MSARRDWWRLIAAKRATSIHARNVVGVMFLWGGTEYFIGYCRRGDRR